jgi:hypothetical protein
MTRQALSVLLAVVFLAPIGVASFNLGRAHASCELECDLASLELYDTIYYYWQVGDLSDWRLPIYNGGFNTNGCVRTTYKQFYRFTEGTPGSCTVTSSAGFNRAGSIDLDSLLDAVVFQVCPGCP